MRYYIFYVDGLPTKHRPGHTNITINGYGINAHRQQVVWSQIQNSEITYEVIDKSASAGKALAGAVLAGGVGAVIGGLSGGKGVNTYLVVNYLANGEPKQLTFTGNTCEKAQKTIAKRLAKYKQKEATKPPKVPRTAKHGFMYYYLSFYRWTYRLYRHFKKA